MCAGVEDLVSVLTLQWLWHRKSPYGLDKPLPWEGRAPAVRSWDRMYIEAPSLATRDFPGLAMFLCVQVP